MNTQKIGKKGEDIASIFLENKGYAILEKNYRYQRNEIDLIVQKNELLIFVEVKLRSNTDYGMPEEVVSEAQKIRIISTADKYIFTKNWQKDIRFDIISITISNNKYVLEHFEDAFF